MQAGMKRFLPKLVAVVAVVAVIVLSALVATPKQSHASAIGYSYWGGFTWNSVYIPAGQLDHTIIGSGYIINSDSATFVSVGNLCDPSVRFTYGNGSMTMNSNVHWGCSHIGLWTSSWYNWKAPRGDACAELWAKNWSIRVTRQCHYVYG